ncbi:MAG: hypothetical protein ACYDDS_21615 [Candidatus Sulfotelmatobacter sp.]
MRHVSPANRHFVIAYILLVGLPLLGLAGVLRFGHGLSAPISVSGVWKLGAEGAPLVDGKCGKGLASLQGALLTISQSGKELIVSVNNESLAIGSGVMEGTTLMATLPLLETPTKEPTCGSDNGITLTATVDPKLEPRSMQGTFSLRECDSCARMKYRAVRQAYSSRVEGH